MKTVGWVHGDDCMWIHLSGRYLCVGAFFSGFGCLVVSRLRVCARGSSVRLRPSCYCCVFIIDVWRIIHKTYPVVFGTALWALKL
jgi:hypothetical protein